MQIVEPNNWNGIDETVAFMNLAHPDFENNIAPKMNIELCPMCGTKLSKTAAAKIQRVENTLDAEFGIAS